MTTGREDTATRDPSLDEEYNACGTVSQDDFTAIMDAYRAESLRAIAGLAGHRDITYDPNSDECLDVWGVKEGTLRPVVIAIHGGYWRMLSRHDTAFMAEVLAEHGIATVTVDYTLSPHATLEEIVRQVRASVAWVFRHGAGHGLDPERIYVIGSSAGGHLTAMTAATGWQPEFGLPDNVVKGAMTISGLYDLRPLVDAFPNEWLSLDQTRAAALSPILLAPSSDTPVIVALAETEASAFTSQGRDFQREWGVNHESELIVVPDRNHFDVFLDLANPESTLTRTLLHLVNPSHP
ncbi:alpha/beta hydrolase [Arthrobacter sp. Rue61a]|uniref:Putative esterase n=1 Tax=Paenarthrobacter ilicis TaxID=43665 RepID=Q7WSQ8_9MICC|nr:alpha/beta hydrolase [Arthrobacter sp. Rue61a]AFR34518.1 N-acetylanthranilate amidase MeqF [Arthrobacter sp. Rue61a]CAD61042.1 putative esterase [Paenarthrobacter ilicis]